MWVGGDGIVYMILEFFVFTYVLLCTIVQEEDRMAMLCYARQEGRKKKKRAKDKIYLYELKLLREPSECQYNTREG